MTSGLFWFPDIFYCILCPIVSASRPKAIDLFAGAGGMSLGFEQAGFDIVAAVEYDPIHAATHHYNFPESKVYAQSVSDLDGKKVLSDLGLSVGQIDLIFGGPPCQGFSLIGHRSIDDERNKLVMDYVRLVDEIRPKAFVFENVKGLTIGKQKKFLVELIEEFQIIGYHVRLPWKVLNAANFGVPQDRERLFLLGAQVEDNVPDYPVGNFSVRGSDNLFDLMPHPTCEDAIGDLPDIDEFEELLYCDKVKIKKQSISSAYASDMRGTNDEAWYFGYRREWDSNYLTSSARTIHTPTSKYRFKNTAPGAIEPISRFFKLHSKGICNTLRAGTDANRGAFTSPRPIHYKHSRCISVREMARLHSYPDWFRFHVTKWHGARQVGNSVPPRLAFNIGKQVMKALKAPQIRPSRTLALGSESLLNFDMKSAANFFDIQPPFSGRTLKGTYRKPKQIELVLA